MVGKDSLSHTLSFVRILSVVLCVYTLVYVVLLFRLFRFPTSTQQIPTDYGGETKHYKWTQTEDDVSVSVTVPEGLRARDLDVVMKPKHLKVAVKGKESIVDVSFFFSS